NRVEPIPIEEAKADIDGSLKLVDYDKCHDQRTGKSPFCHVARAEAADLQVPSVIRDEIGIGEARNLTDDWNEGDQINEQSKNRESDGKARGRARLPPSLEATSP